MVCTGFKVETWSVLLTMKSGFNQIYMSYWGVAGLRQRGENLNQDKIASFTLPPNQFINKINNRLFQYICINLCHLIMK